MDGGDPHRLVSHDFGGPLVDLASVIAARATGATRLAPGTVTETMRVSVEGGEVTALWADNIAVEAGDRVLVALSREPGQQSTAIVLCRVTDSPRPTFGTVTEAVSSSPTVQVDAGGVEINAHRLDDALPAVGSTVALLWQGATPLVLGKRTIVTVGPGEGGPTSAPSINAPSSGGGPVTVSAYSSATWDGKRNRFNSYYSKLVGQGAWAGYGPLTGAWYYGDAGRALTGRAKSLSIYLPARRPGMGVSSAAMSVKLSLHSDKWQSGYPSPTGTAHTTSLPAGWAGGNVSLPASWIPRLADGAGIVMHGPSYGGVGGRPVTAQSGQLTAH